MLKLTAIPSILVGLRLTIAPLLLLDAWDRHPSAWFVGGYIIAVLSDIFDGIIARKLGVSTVKLRQADSWADICLYVGVAASTWLVYPQVVTQFQTPLLCAAIAQLSLFSCCLVKFRQFPSYHTYTAKAWGLTLLIATVGLFGFGYADTLWLAIVFCLLNTVEEIAMTIILPEWQCDVLSIFHAVNLRQTLNSAAAQPPQTDRT
jgi:phosphatidylglycerophosphate synthase